MRLPLPSLPRAREQHPPRRALTLTTLTLTQMRRCREVPPANQTIVNTELSACSSSPKTFKRGHMQARVQVGHTSQRSMETSYAHAQNSWPGQAGHALLPAPRAHYQGQLQHRCCLALQAARSLGSSQPDALHLRALLAGSCGSALRSPCIRRHASTIRSKSALWLPRWLGSHPVHGKPGAHLPVPLVLRAKLSPVSIYGALCMHNKAHTRTRSTCLCS